MRDDVDAPEVPIVDTSRSEVSSRNDFAKRSREVNEDAPNEERYWSMREAGLTMFAAARDRGRTNATLDGVTKRTAIEMFNEWYQRNVGELPPCVR